MKKNMKKAGTEMLSINKDSTEKPSAKKDSIKRIRKKRNSLDFYGRPGNRNPGEADLQQSTGRTGTGR